MRPTPQLRLAVPLLLLASTIVLSGCGVDRVDAAQAKPSWIDQMNAASKTFTSAQADLRQELFTKVVQDTETRTGQIYLMRKGGATQMGVRMFAADAKPGAQPAQIVEFKDGKLQLLTTGTGQVDVFNATGKNQALAESLMSLGFGGNDADLEKSWTVTDLGPESIGGVQTEKLDLVSKDLTIKGNYSHITIWLDPARDVTLKQIFIIANGGKPTGDTRTVFFSNIRLNEKTVNTAPFAIKCPSKCTFVPR